MTTQLPAPSTGPRLRASDDDRAATVATLQDAMARGLLGHDEGGDRLAAAFAAVHRDELPPLTADLPAAVAADSPTAAVGWRRLAAMLVLQIRAEFAATVAAGVRSRRFVVAVLVALALIGLVVLGSVTGHGFEGGHEGFDGGR
jgi:hypothetical protein